MSVIDSFQDYDSTTADRITAENIIIAAAKLDFFLCRNHCRLTCFWSMFSIIQRTAILFYFHIEINFKKCFFQLFFFLHACVYTDFSGHSEVFNCGISSALTSMHYAALQHLTPHFDFTWSTSSWLSWLYLNTMSIRSYISLTLLLKLFYTITVTELFRTANGDCTDRYLILFYFFHL